MIGTKAKCITFLANAPDDKYYEIKEYKEGRSKKANNYFHRLVGLLAKGEQARFYAKKNELIMQYGNHELERDKNGKPIYEYLEDNDEYKSHPVHHYVPTSFTDTFKGRNIRAFVLLKGTHTYNSADMAHLIECTRNECAGCGIDWSEIETFEEKQLFEGLKNGRVEKNN